MNALLDVTDDVFRQNLMGDGLRVDPLLNEALAPVAGTISTVFPTKQRIGITTPSGLLVLVHMGLLTVELEGKPSSVSVNLNDTVTAGQILATIDVDDFKASGYDDTTLVIYTNMDKLNYFPTVDDCQRFQGHQIGLLVYS